MAASKLVSNYVPAKSKEKVVLLCAILFNDGYLTSYNTIRLSNLITTYKENKLHCIERGPLNSRVNTTAHLKLTCLEILTECRNNSYSTSSSRFQGQ